MSVSDRVIAIANKTRHDDLCREIARDLPTFIRIGSRLKELQQLEVYKETHKTFESFVLAEFGLSRARAYQLIDAAEVETNLSTICRQNPLNEAHLREVAKAPAEQQAEVVKKAVEKAAEENRKPTAKDYKQAAKTVVGELVDEDEEKPKESTSETHHPKQMAGPLMAHVKTLVQMLNDLKKRKDERGGEWIDVQAISTQISALKYSLKSSIYYADCPACKGKGCEKCKQTGFLPELKSASLEELK